MEEVRPTIQKSRHGSRTHSGKMTPNGNGFAVAQTAYDDVFGGPPKYTVPSFPPCVDEYAEIFRGSSPAQKTPPVPFLELSSDYHGEVALISGDLYADIFGGFACDFTVSLEELLGRLQARAEKRAFRGDCARKTRVEGERNSLEKLPTKRSSNSLENSHGILPSSSEKISVASNSAYQQWHGTHRQLDMSFQMMNHKSKENSESETHVTDLDDVSKCTFAVDADLPLVDNHSMKTNASTCSASNIAANVAEMKLDISEIKPMTGTLSHDSHGNCLPKMFRNELKEDSSNIQMKPSLMEDGSFINSHDYPSCHNYHVRNYDPTDIFLTVTEINLQTQPTDLPPPSRPPPKLDIKQGDSNKRLGSNIKDFHENGSGTCLVEEASRQSSPRFLDVEVDVNSAAAASAAAIKEVMEEAKARLKIARESRERRRNNLKSCKLADRERKKMREPEVDREEKGNKEQEECDSAQEFFECTLELTPEVSDWEFKEVSYCNQEEHNDMRRSKKVSEYEEKQRCFDLAEECAEKNLENGSNMFKEFEKHRMKEKLSDCNQRHEHKETLPPPVEVFELQEMEGSFDLDQRCAEEMLGNETSLVTDYHNQESRKREHQVEEVLGCKVSDKKQNLSFESSGTEQSRKKLKADQNACGREDDIKKQNTIEQSEDDMKLKAAQEAQQQEEKEKLKTDQKYWEGNKGEEKVTAIEETHQQGESSDGLKTYQESRKQEKVHLNKPMAAEELVGREEAQQREEREGKRTATLETYEEREILNRLKTSQESTKQHELHNNEEKAAREEAQQEEEKEKKLKTVHNEYEGNEREQKITAAGETHEQSGSPNRLSTTQESRKLDEVHKNKQKAAQEGAQQQEEKEKKLKTVQDWEAIERATKRTTTRETHQHRESSNGLKAVEECRQKEEIPKHKQNTAQEESLPQEKMEQQVKTGQDWEETEKLEKSTATEENFEQRESLNRLKNAQESRKQDRVHQNKANAAEEPLVHEENVKLKTDEVACEHKQSERAFRTLQDSDDPEANKQRQNTIQAIPLQDIKEKKNEAAQHVNKLEEKDKILKMSHKINEIQGTEQKIRKFNETHERGEKEKSQADKERLKRDREQEMEWLMKLEEEKEREREREKDRIAVERATNEACDKSAADAWDKAERAAVERATTEAREKAESTPSESKVGDKASTEARFRAERVALDRATIEARERAAERAIVEKVAAEARERMERAVAERFAASLRNRQKKDNECEEGTSLRMNNKKHTATEKNLSRDVSSNASHSNGKHTDFEVETEKRRKARLDRYQRTTERAAKALAEKKARDILAQREQAERNRLAETLDGDIKRWSNGKEGNLRALLSTLQYILGPESGWQPVPLTEVITSAAVKKAYRKATLCVHPDKVQQRGASIQQKYISEKVFDLLKEAWNKFNSEER